MSTLTIPPTLPPLLEPHVPPPSSSQSQSKPFLTLTFATSLDSSLSLAPGVRTALSGPESKAMTHYLRSRHDAILIGAGTAIADDPGLNCRIAGGSSPRPIVLDPRGRWVFSRESKVLQLVTEGKGLAPWVFVGEGVDVDEGRRGLLEERGGRYVPVRTEEGRFRWRDLLDVLKGLGVRSVMVEGGGEVINSLLRGEERRMVDSVIVTIAPTWLGKGGVVVSPERDQDGPVRLTEVKWIPLGEDVVVCGRIKG
ncbi:hypothetical protein OQA88_12857 [Cercophora sp. LCS_1]